MIPDGVWPVMITPFRADKTIDWDGVNRLIDCYVEAGIAGLFAVCLSSEMFDLDAQERFALAQHIAERVPEQLPVIASGTFGHSPQALVDSTRRMSETGVMSVVCLSGAFAAAGEDDTTWQRRAAQFLSRTDEIPLGLYECPRPYHRVLEADTLAWAASTGRFSFLKDTSGQKALVIQKLRATKGSRIRLYDAVADTLLDSLRLGAKGFSGISTNFVPELWVWLCRNFRNDPAVAVRLHDFLCEAELVFSKHYPASAKRFLQLRNIGIETVCRTNCGDISKQHERELNFMRVRADEWRMQLGLGH